MSQSPFAKQTVYHSAIRDASPITVRIISEPTKSKFQRNGHDQYYVDFEIAGHKHNYICENDGVREGLRGLRNHMVELTAKGSQEDATMDIRDVAAPGTETPPPNRSSSPQRRAEQSPRGDSSGRQQAAASCGRRARGRAMQIANCYLLSLDTATYIADEYKRKHGFPMEDSHFQAATSTIFISLDRANAIDDMPAHPIKPKDATHAKAPEPPRQQQPPREQPAPREQQRQPDPELEQPEEDDIPF